jgi:hypothetical protein
MSKYLSRWGNMRWTMKKKIIILAALLSCLFFGQAYADNPPKVYLFDELVDMDNPIIVNGNTLVPLRVLFESLGASVTWDDQSKIVKAKKGDTELSIQIGNKSVSKNGSTITLEEPAAIINDKTYVPLRFVAESFNQDVTWDKDNNSIHIGRALTAKDISKLAAPAVVYIETFDSDNKPYASGSGFIIDKTGQIVTNYHVIDGASSATIRLIDGKSFPVSKVIDYSVGMDIALLKVDSYGEFPTIKLGDSDKITSGETVFAIGSPRGLENTISSGLISNTSRLINKQLLIQLSAEITHGSSGGALLNDRGEVIGITSSGTGEADLNFAVPINNVKYVDKNKNFSIQQVYEVEHVIRYTDAIYVGDKQNNMPNGTGIMKFNDGDQYIGSFLNGKFDGKGKYIWINGYSYDGDWVNGLKQGIGKSIDNQGNIFEGQFNNDLPNGKGKITYPNGDTFFCDFLNGLANGYGTYYYANGTSFSGVWVNNNYIK